jgi:AraC-like DNA-binding protein
MPARASERMPIPIECRFLTGDVGERPDTFRVDWRTLPFMIVEQTRGGSYVIEHADPRVLRTQPDQAWVIPRGVRHRLSVPPGHTATAIYAHMSCTAFGGLDLFEFVPHPIVFSGSTAWRIGELCEALARNRQSHGPEDIRSAAREHELSYGLLGLLMDEAPELFRTQWTPQLTRMEPALRFIGRNLSRRISRAELASRVHLSPTRFHHAFKEALGEAPMSYVRRLRMDRARQMLIHTDLTVAEIAHRVGFEDPYYFSRCFGREDGRPPTAYRRQMRMTAS